MRQLIVAVASRRRPSKGHLAPSLLDDFTNIRELGRGGRGTVYLATPKSGGEDYPLDLLFYHLKLRRVRPAYLPKSGCGVPPQAVVGGVSPPVLRPLHFSVSAFRISVFTHSPLNDIAITQMETLLSASTVKRLN